MDRDEQQPSLRERGRRQTEDEIGIAALDLFERHGDAATTAEAIARCATKEQAVMLGDGELEADLLATLGALRAGDDAYAALEAYWQDALIRLGTDPASGDRFLRVRRLALHEPTVLATSLRLDAERTEQRAALVAGTGATPLRPARSSTPSRRWSGWPWRSGCARSRAVNRPTRSRSTRSAGSRSARRSRVAG
ncbi:hypothetical protein [Pseudonocardia sp.]|uniref:hypothetical protein n=1 Tax=Pseudonocardia sp. TaxID=60912 RepID=UPI003D141D78